MDIAAVLSLLSLVTLACVLLARSLWRRGKQIWVYGLLAAVCGVSGVFWYLYAIAGNGFLAGFGEVLVALGLLIGPAAGLFMGLLFAIQPGFGAVALVIYVISLASFVFYVS